MSLIANGKQIDTGADLLLDWGRTLPALIADAEQPEPKITQTSNGSFSQLAGNENWKPRSGTLYGHIKNQGDIVTKFAALGVVGTALLASSPGNLIFQGRQLRGVKFQSAKPAQDHFTNHPTALNYTAAWIAKDPFWWDLGPWATMGYYNGAQSFGLNVGHTTTAISGTATGGAWYIAPTTSGALTLTVPGSACAYGVGSMTVAGGVSGTFYLKSDHGFRYVPVVVTNGVGIIQLADRLYLAPGANTITVYTLSGSTYSVYTAQTVTINLGQTYARWLGFDSSSSSVTSCPPLVLARTGSATYISTAGSLATAGDGVARFGLPYVVRRNQFLSSGDLTGAAWTATSVSLAFSAVASPLGTGTGLVTTITASAANSRHGLRTLPTYTGAYVESIYVRKNNYRYFGIRIGDSGVSTHATFDLDTGAFIVTPTGYTTSVTALSDGWYRISAAYTWGGSAGVTGFGLVSAAGAESWIAAGTEAVYVYGPQVDATAITPHQPTNSTGVDLTNAINGAGLVLEGSATNFLLNSDSPATQSVSLAAGTYTLSLTGSGSVALSGGPTGTATATSPVTFTLVGTTSVTFTKSGTVSTFDCQNLPFASSHISTGAAAVTRGADSCGIVPLQQEIRYSNDLSQSSAWTVSGMSQPTVSGGLSTVTFGSTAHYIYQATTPTDPTSTRTAYVRIRQGTLSGSVKLQVMDSGGTIIGSATTITTANLSPSTSQTYAVTVTPGATVTGLRVELIGSSGAGTVIVEAMGMVKGSMPGTHVVTTDTAVPLGAGTWPDSGWQQRGQISGYIVVPSGANVAAGTVILGASGGILITQFASTITLSRVTNGGTRTVTITLNAADGYRHFFSASWDSYTTAAGAKSMPITLTVDSTTATVDLAATYGDSSYTTSDPTKLLSGGSVFSVLSGINLSTPTLPSGAIAAA